MKRARFAVVRNVGTAAFIGIVLAGHALAQPYLPDWPNVPTITLNEDQSGAAGLPPLNVPQISAEVLL
jgi:hypothetical protein